MDKSILPGPPSAIPEEATTMEPKSGARLAALLFQGLSPKPARAHRTTLDPAAGPWPVSSFSVSRTIESRRPEMPSGRFDGRATFKPTLATDLPANRRVCAPSEPSAGAVFDLGDGRALRELGYAEDGIFEMGGHGSAAGPLRMPAAREYIYRLVLPDTPEEGADGEIDKTSQGDTGPGDKVQAGRACPCPGMDARGGESPLRQLGLSAWFVDVGQGGARRTDRLFHQLELSDMKEQKEEKKQEGGGGQRWHVTASGKHFCSPDWYNAEYEFWITARWGGEQKEKKEWRVDKMRIVYEVRGPRKDYTSDSWYEREQ